MFRAPHSPPLTAGLGRPGPYLPCLVVLVHLAYLTLIFAVQPADRVGDGIEGLPLHLYGEQDLAAMALRGLNAALGRTAGRPDVPPDLDAADYARALQEDRLLEPRYYLEYPHADLVLFCLPWWLFGPVEHPPAALLDGSLGNVTAHRPVGQADGHVWRQLRRAHTVYRVVLFGLLVGLVVVLWRGYSVAGDLSSSCWPLLLPCPLYYTVNRFDIVPVFFTALALAALGRRRHFLSGMCLAAGALSKVFPGLLVPLVLRYLFGRPGDRRAAAAWLAGFTLIVVAGVLPPLLREGLDAVWSPYHWQMTRAPFLWTAYGYLLPPYLGGGALPARLFRPGALLLVLAVLTWRRIPDMAELVRRSGAFVIVFVLLQSVFSPQWVLWFVPFLLPLLGRLRWLAPLLVVLDLATIVLWPDTPSAVWLADAVQLTRLASMLGLVAVLLLGGRRAPAIADGDSLRPAATAPAVPASA